MTVFTCLPGAQCAATTLLYHFLTAFEINVEFVSMPGFKEPEHGLIEKHLSENSPFVLAILSSPIELNGMQTT
jgi:hypothetical protein